MWHKVKRWGWAIAVLALLLFTTSVLVQVWTAPGDLTGRDGFVWVQLGGLIAIGGVVWFVRKVVQADRRDLERRKK